MRLNHPGVYRIIGKDFELLANIEGEAPLFKITSAILINDLVNYGRINELQPDSLQIRQILEDPDSFVFLEYEYSEVAVLPNHRKSIRGNKMPKITDFEMKDFIISAKHLAELVKLIDNKQISNKQAREVFSIMLKKDDDPQQIVASLGQTMVSDEEVILNLIHQVLQSNKQSIQDYKNGKDRALGYLVGQVMKLSKGQANPGLTSKLLLKEIEKY